MPLFGRKKEPQPTGLVGVDIGAGGIKAVELTKENGRMRLLTYGYAVANGVEDPKKIFEDTKQAGQALHDIWKKAGMKATRANASLPSHSVFHAIITIPRPKDVKENIKPMIETQVKKLLPMPLEQMIIDSTVIDKIEEKKNDALKNIRVMVSGAPKTLVSRYVELFKIAKLELASLETEAFALIRSLIGNDKSRIMVVDIGYERTNIIVVSQGVPFLHRSVKAGGGLVTNAIAKQMGVSLKEAEQTKRDLAESSEDDLPPILKESIQPILHEVKYSLELFASQSFNEPANIEKIIVTGGSAHLPQIDRFLTEALNINVYIGDPWARIATQPGLRPVLDEVGPMFSVAIGLGMKDLHEKK